MPARTDLPLLERHTKSLSPSCEQCAEGRKLVLFVTGVCDTGCFYCPLSETRNQQPFMYANERIVLGRTSEALARRVVEEAHALGAAGAGVTGGDPMLVPDLAIAMFGALKAEFGPKFDNHLYTSKTPDEARRARRKAAGFKDDAERADLVGAAKKYELQFCVRPAAQWGSVISRLASALFAGGGWRPARPCSRSGARHGSWQSGPPGR